MPQAWFFVPRWCRRAVLGAIALVGAAVALGTATPATACGCQTPSGAFVSAMQGDLRALVEAQERFRAMNGTYATLTTGVLRQGGRDLWRATPKASVVAAGTASSARGWSALLAHPGTNRLCAISVGADGQRFFAEQGQVDGVPLCFHLPEQGELSLQAHLVWGAAFGAAVFVIIWRLRQRGAGWLLWCTLVVVCIANPFFREVAQLVWTPCAGDAPVYLLLRDAVWTAVAVTAVIALSKWRPAAPQSASARAVGRRNA